MSASPVSLGLVLVLSASAHMTAIIYLRAQPVPEEWSGCGLPETYESFGTGEPELAEMRISILDNPAEVRRQAIEEARTGGVGFKPEVQQVELIYTVLRHDQGILGRVDEPVFWQPAAPPPFAVSSNPYALPTGHAQIAVAGASDARTSALRREVQRSLPRLAACYEPAFVADPSAAGDLYVELDLAATGRVTAATATGFDDAVASCVASALAGIGGPQLAGTEDVRVRIPMTFRPHHPMRIVRR